MTKQRGTEVSLTVLNTLALKPYPESSGACAPAEVYNSHLMR